MTGNSLKNAIGSINLGKFFTPEKIKECQELLDDANHQFLDEAFAQTEVMHKLYCDANHDTSQAPDNIKNICQIAYQMKSRMEALGFIFCYEIADSLYQYSRKLPTYNQTTLMVVAKHIHALQAAMRENCAGDGGVIGKEMVEMLRALVKKSS